MFAARLIARGGKEEGDFSTSEGKERKGDLYLESVFR